MTVSKISLDYAKSNKLFYFVASAVVYRKSDGRCLLLKRSEREKVHPGLWGVIGGKLEWENLDVKNPTRINGDVLDFEHIAEALLAREAKEEAGIKIQSQLAYLDSVAFVRPDGVPVVLVKFGAQFKLGEVVINRHDFSDFAWVNAREVRNYQTIVGISEELQKTINIFSTGYPTALA